MSEWIEYTGSDEQVIEILKSDHGLMTEDFVIIDGGNRSAPICDLLSIGEKFLICQPHPYADMIKIWADTGCPVYVKFAGKYDGTDFINCTATAHLKSGTVFKTYIPNWDVPGAKYSLTPFDD